MSAPDADGANHAPDKVPSFNHLDLAWPRPGVANLALNRAPVNALNLQMWKSLLNALTYLEKEQFPHHTRVLVISSGLSTPVFTAGNDLTELHVPSTTRARFIAFWRASTNFLGRLHASPLATVAALRGAVPAGGCCIALCCDYRVAASDVKIGLNETALGISVPEFWARRFAQVVTPPARAEELLMRGKMIGAEEAKTVGLVNEVVDGKEHAQLMERALEYAGEWATDRLVVGRVLTKLALRKDFSDAWIANGAREARLSWKFLSKEETAEALGNVLKRLSRPKM